MERRVVDEIANQEEFNRIIGRFNERLHPGRIGDDEGDGDAANYAGHIIPGTVRHPNGRAHATMTNTLSDHTGRNYIPLMRTITYVDLISGVNRIISGIYSTPLHDAVAQSQDLLTVAHLLNSGRFHKDCTNQYGETALLLAVREMAPYDIIDLLIRSGCDVTKGCRRGMTALYYATFNNDIRLMDQLIVRGADVNKATHTGMTPLHLAVITNNYEAVYKLLTHHANTAPFTSLGFTPLMLALAFRGISLRIVELLLDRSLLNTTTFAGNAIYFALRARHSYVYTLIAEGADVNYVGKLWRNKTFCLIEALSLDKKDLFLFIWSKIDQTVFIRQLKDFLAYFVAYCRLTASDLVECLVKILRSSYAKDMITCYYVHSTKPFLKNIFGKMNRYNLTSDHCCDIISALPIVYYIDVSYVFKKFYFHRELECLLMSNPPITDKNRALRVAARDCLNESRIQGYVYIDYLVYNTMTANISYLNEVKHFLMFCTPNTNFRVEFHMKFSGEIAGALIPTYNLCAETLGNRHVASLLELSRNAVREAYFPWNSLPYKSMAALRIPRVLKEILFLKMPIYIL